MEPGTALEQILFAMRRGAMRDDVYQWWPSDTAWLHRGNALIAPSGAIAPFRHVEHMFIAEKLYNVKLVTTVAGGFDAFETLEVNVRRQLPSIASWSEVLARPWSTQSARGRLENKGSERVMSGVAIEGESRGRGKVTGKALAFKRGTEQHYGFELFWMPT